MSSKGVILAGGTASRMYPLTIANNKHLLPVYSKPMIYYSLSTLLLSGEREIVIVTSEQFKESFYSLLGDGKQFGIKIDYAIQEEADGLASAINAAGKFIKNKRIKVILGDNIFGKGFEDILKIIQQKKKQFYLHKS